VGAWLALWFQSAPQRHLTSPLHLWVNGLEFGATA